MVVHAYYGIWVRLANDNWIDLVYWGKWDSHNTLPSVSLMKNMKKLFLKQSQRV